MKIFSLGDDRPVAQLCRIRAGFEELGHENVNNPAEADFCYSNDSGGYEQLLKIKDELGKKIGICCLDVPTHLPNPDKIVKNWKNCFERADYVFSISQTTQKQVQEFFGRQSFIIYQPIQPVKKLTGEKKYKIDYLLVGRQTDPAKRIGLFYEYWQKYDPDSIVWVVGPEDPRVFNFAGIQDVETLNQLYHSANFVFCGGSNEGIQLPIIETFCASNGFPICLNDCAASLEFARLFCCEPNPESICKKIAEIEKFRSVYFGYADKYCRIYEKKFSPVNVARNILEVVKT